MVAIVLAYAVLCPKGPALFFDEEKALAYASKYHGRIVPLEPRGRVRSEDMLPMESQTMELFSDLE